MLSIFGYNEKKFIGFEDVKFAINNDKFLIINTLPSLLFGNYNIFTDISNNIILDNTKY